MVFHIFPSKCSRSKFYYFQWCKINEKSLTKLYEGVRPHGAADAFCVIRDEKLFLQLVQEAEGQHVGVISSADHQVSNTQGVNETKTQTQAQTLLLSMRRPALFSGQKPQRTNQSNKLQRVK